VLWPGAATDLANAQGLGMAVLLWRLMGAHGLSAAFTVDAGYRAFAVTAFMLLEGRGRDTGYPAPTGSPEAVTRPRLPQNVACGFAALRSSGVGSQHRAALKACIGQKESGTP
jgi:hypothetical protein